nr:hypothetical protein BaRGS_033110 [Batillaria attramentaria]
MCPMEYGGRTCHRLVRDCSEVFENGYTEKSFSGMFTIQPITAPNPFQVRCHFEWGVGITYTFERQEWSNFDTKTWSEIRDGFGDPSSEEYFIGLDNLHHLSTQGGYELHIYFNYWGKRGGKGC